MKATLGFVDKSVLIYNGDRCLVQSLSRKNTILESVCIFVSVTKCAKRDNIVPKNSRHELV